MKSWFNVKAAVGGEKKTDIHIFEEIGLWGVTAKDFAGALKAIPEDHEITLHINSPGGSVFDGYAMFNALKARAANVTAVVEGLAASMASIVMLAGIKTKAAANSLVMIHNPWSGAAGESEDLRKAADLLDKITAQIAGIYAAKTGQSEDAIRAAMDAETWFTAAEAKEWGLVDDLVDEIPAMASHDLSRFRNAPTGSAEPVAGIIDHAEAQPNAEVESLRAELATAKQQAENSAAQISALKVEADQSASALSAAAAELATIKATLAARDARDAISAAIAAGKITEEARERFEAMHTEDAATCAAILDAIKPQMGAQPLAAEAEDEVSSDAKILAEYRGLTGDARTKFYAEHEAAIWRAYSAA